MATEREIFYDSESLRSSGDGVDWSEKQHRTRVAASLVQGVYNLERDRKENNQGPQDTGTQHYWESFGFELNHRIQDNRDKSYFGAIYKYRFGRSSNNSRGRNPPSYVIAFRGTLTNLENLKKDLEADIQLVLHKLHENIRSHIALKEVQRIVAQAGHRNVWLAGHSLGSAIALLVGRNMVVADNGVHLETYLFNPPFPSLSIEQIITDDHEKTKRGLGIIKNLMTAGCATVVYSLRPKIKQENRFTELSNWTPYLFVNSGDPICRGYIDYFKQRETMESIGLRSIGRVATQNSVRCLISIGRGKKREPIHLIPSAVLFMNLAGPPDEGTKQGLKIAERLKKALKKAERLKKALKKAERLEKAHRLKQWYEPGIDFNETLYQYE